MVLIEQNKPNDNDFTNAHIVIYVDVTSPGFRLCSLSSLIFIAFATGVHLSIEDRANI